MADPWAVQSVSPAKDDGWSVASVSPAKPARRKRTLTEDVTGFMANVNRGLGIGDELAAGFRTAGNVLSGKTPVQNVLADFKDSMKGQRDTEDEFARERPKAAALGRGTGMAITAAVPTGQSANLLSQSGRVVNALRGATTAGLTGAAYAAADRGTIGERARAAAGAAHDPVTLALGAAGGALAPAAKKTPKVKPTTADVNLLAEEGVRMTPGQIRGGVAKAAEDAGTSMPFLGQAISERRTEGIEDFNRAVINRTLKPLGDKLPDDIAIGTDAVKYAGDKLSAGYESAVPGKVVRADPGFADDVANAFRNLGTLTEDARKRLLDILDQRVTGRIPQNGEIDGRLYKQIQSELDFEVARFSKAADPDQRAIGDAIEAVQAALEAAARRQDPQFAAKLNALDAGWAELARVEAAASKSTDLSGIFTPKQYTGAIRAGDSRVRRRGVARGEALSQDLARAGARVLPSQMPDSGTAGRAAWGMLTTAPGAVIGAIMGGGPGAVAGIGGTAATLAAASRIYTPAAIQATNAALKSQAGSQAQRQALRELAEAASQNPEARKLYQEVLKRLSLAAGAAGVAPQAAVAVEVEGRPDLGVGYSSENLLAAP